MISKYGHVQMWNAFQLMLVDGWGDICEITLLIFLSKDGHDTNHEIGLLYRHSGSFLRETSTLTDTLMI